MANDLQAMIFRCAAELGSRFDLAGATGSANPSQPNSEAIRNAINTSISEYQKQRFRFNEIDPGAPPTLNTVVHQYVYGEVDSPLINTLYFWDYLNILQSNTLMRMQRVTPEEQHLNIQAGTQFGLPSSWAYEGNSIILYPIPDAVYTLYIGAHIWVPGPLTDNEVNNPWMTSAEALVRSRAKYEVALHVTRDQKRMADLDPDSGATYRYWKSLKSEANKVTGTGRVKAMKF